MTETKKCKRCWRVLPLEQFHTNRHGNRRQECRSCAQMFKGGRR